MANQIVVSAGAKVRNLSGVLTATSGVVSFLPIDVSLGIPQLDVNGKILVSQLPNSVMEYKGTWDASTNTPTLANGTGNQGDVYLCNVAGTVNFGAGAIAFVVGDQVIYSGSIWQRASGATGTVTSVAVTESGDSLNITGSPIVNSGTINIGFNGTNLQYVNGAGNLTTFPILTGYVTAVSGTAPVVSSGGTTPAISMAAATASVDGYLLATDFAIFNAKQSALTFSSPLVNTSGTISIPAATTSVNGYLASADFTTFNNKQNAITLTTTGTSGVSTLVGATLNIPDYGSALTGYVTLATTQTISGAKTFSGGVTFSSSVTTNNLTFANSGFFLTLQPPTLSVNRTVTLPNGTGTLALTSDISYPVTSVFGRTGAVVATSGDYTTTQVTEGTNLYFTDARARAAISLTTTGTSGAATYVSGVLNIPQYQGVLTNPITGTGTSGQVAYFNGTSSLTSSATFAFTPTSQLLVNNSVTAASLIARGTNLTPTLTAAANSDVLVGLDINPTFTNGVFTGVSNYGLRVQNFSLFTTSKTSLQGVVDIYNNTSSNPNSTSLNVFSPNMPNASVVGIIYGGKAITTRNGIGINWNHIADGSTGNYASFNISGVNDIIRLWGSGNTTIGGATTDANYKLDVNGTARVQNFTTITHSKTNSQGVLEVLNTTSSNPNSNSVNILSPNMPTSSVMGIIYGGKALSSFNGFGINWNHSADGSTANSTSFNFFGVNDIIRMWGTGNVAINSTTDSGYKLDVNGTGRFVGAITAAGALFTSATETRGNIRTTFASDNSYYSLFSNDGALTLDTYGVGGYMNFKILGSTKLTIASTGAATFSSSVTTNESIFVVKSKSGTGVESYNLLTLRLAGTGAIGDSGNIAWRSYDGSYTIASINGISGADNVAYGSLAFSTRNYFTDSLVEVMRINNRGNVGIGTTSPQAKLDLQNGNVGFYNNTASSGGAQLYIGDMNFAGGAYATSAPGIGSVASPQTSVAGDLAFYVYASAAGSRSEVMRIIRTSTGNRLGIGTTTPVTDVDINAAISGAYTTSSSQAPLRVFNVTNAGGINSSFISLQCSTDGSASNPVARIGVVGETAGSNNGAMVMMTRDGSGVIERMRIASTGAITCTSSVTATSFFESSDSRLKTLIQDNYQTKGIASITPKLYTKNGKVELGYYAQDFVGVLDSAVSKGSDDMLSLSYREVLVAKVYALEQEIKELKAKMN